MTWRDESILVVEDVNGDRVEYVPRKVHDRVVSVFQRKLSEQTATLYEIDATLKRLAGE